MPPRWHLPRVAPPYPVASLSSAAEHAFATKLNTALEASRGNRPAAPTMSSPRRVKDERSRGSGDARHRSPASEQKSKQRSTSTPSDRRVKQPTKDVEEVLRQQLQEERQEQLRWRAKVEKLQALLNSKESQTKSPTPSSGQSLPADTALAAPDLAIPKARNVSPQRKEPRVFDASKFSTRHIALKIAYVGGRYGGFEHANNNVTPQPTIEEVLWKALRKTRLISPEIEEGWDTSFEVFRDADGRMTKYAMPKAQRKVGAGQGGRDDDNEAVKLMVNWEGCQYSKGGRTDRGVSAFGQVIGIRVRSYRPLERKEDEAAPAADAAAAALEHTVESSDNGATSLLADGDLTAETKKKPFDPIYDELPYISALNGVLPPDIRVLAWCPVPPPDFDARFSCGERQYKYFFINPCFSPQPKSDVSRRSGSGVDQGSESGARYLDIEKMREAAKKLEGLHDFRNLCKIDQSKQMEDCVRRITFADVVEWGVNAHSDVQTQGVGQPSGSQSQVPGAPNGPKVYTFCVHGTAFLWHQVRCMVAVLFLVGQGLEEPSIIDELLDVEKNPGKPLYEMADDKPLVLWDCIYPGREARPGEKLVDSLKWIYAGDQMTNDTGRSGKNGLIPGLWASWYDTKMQEVLTDSLLGLALTQGDRSGLQNVQHQPSRAPATRLFDGSSWSKSVKQYVPLVRRSRLADLKEQNARWLDKHQSSHEGNMWTIDSRKGTKRMVLLED
jgi:tRNA pseudouridine38/39 synthase